MDAALAEAIREKRAEVLVVRGTPVTEAMLESCSRARKPAVARINLDQAPWAALLKAMHAGSGDIIVVQVIAIGVDS